MIACVKREQQDMHSPERMAYLTSLPFFQELYVEWLVERSSLYTLYYQDVDVGYVCISDKKILVEFFIRAPYLYLKEELFDALIKELNPQKAYVKSFDCLFLACCIAFHKKCKPLGLLFRHINERIVYSKDPGFSVKIADDSDYSFLAAQGNDLYENEEELNRLVGNRNIYMYRLGNELIGCGLKIRVHARFDYYDIGMWVKPEYRGKGYAKQIIGDLKQICHREHVKPICGCAIENVASRKVLEANGMNSVHHLLEFAF